MFIKSNKWLQFDESDVEIFLVGSVLRMWLDAGDINNLRIGAIIINMDDAEFNGDRISAFPVILAVSSFDNWMK